MRITALFAGAAEEKNKASIGSHINEREAFPPPPLKIAFRLLALARELMGLEGTPLQAGASESDGGGGVPWRTFGLLPNSLSEKRVQRMVREARGVSGCSFSAWKCQAREQ